MPAGEIRKREQLNNDKNKKQEEKIVNSEDLVKHEQIDTGEAIDRIVNVARFFNRELRFEIEKDLDIVIVKVIDGETEEVIRQLPPEELVKLSRNAKDLKGLLINKEG